MAGRGQYVYWTNSQGNRPLQRHREQPDLHRRPVRAVRFVAVSPQNVFWANARGIGRASLDGSSANYSFISGVTQPNGVAVSTATGRACAGRHATIVGSAATTGCPGPRGADVIFAGGGDDRIDGKRRRRPDLRRCRSTDRLRGGAGRDQLRGGPGKDALLGGAGRDRLRGGSGLDREEQ